MKKNIVKKEDNRYVIFYDFTHKTKENRTGKEGKKCQS